MCKLSYICKCSLLTVVVESGSITVYLSNGIFIYKNTTM